MALVLTIPNIVDSQELHSLHPEPDGVTFELTFDYNQTATRLMTALERGEMIELVVLTTDGRDLRARRRLRGERLLRGWRADRVPGVVAGARGAPGLTTRSDRLIDPHRRGLYRGPR